MDALSASDAKRLKELETQNTRLKKLLAEQVLENEVIKNALRKKVVSAPARRELVRYMVEKRLSERRSLAIARMSASAYRYVPRPDGNAQLRQQILDLEQRHKRYGVGMIHLKLLRQAGLLVNHKRVERLYQQAELQVRRRKRKKVRAAE